MNQPWPTEPSKKRNKLPCPHSDLELLKAAVIHGGTVVKEAGKYQMYEREQWPASLKRFVVFKISVASLLQKLNIRLHEIVSQTCVHMCLSIGPDLLIYAKIFSPNTDWFSSTKFCYYYASVAPSLHDLFYCICVGRYTLAFMWKSENSIQDGVSFPTMLSVLWWIAIMSQFVSRQI